MDTALGRVVDALPGLVWTARPDGQIEFVGERWCDHTGLSVADVHRRGWRAAIHPEDVSELLERWRSIPASGEPGTLRALVSCNVSARPQAREGAQRPSERQRSCLRPRS
jgi:PAS domain-containing protein